MPKAHTYLNFQGNTEEAFDFYKSVFGGEYLNLVRFRDMGDMGGENRVGDADLDKIMHVGLSLGNGSFIMGTDALESMGHEVRMGNNSYIFIETDSAQEAARLYEALSQGGKVEMGLQQTSWAEKFGSLSDKFGVQWMVNFTGGVQFGG